MSSASRVLRPRDSEPDDRGTCGAGHSGRVPGGLEESPAAPPGPAPPPMGTAAGVRGGWQPWSWGGRGQGGTGVMAELRPPHVQILILKP